MAPRGELFRAAVVTGPGAGFLLSGGAARGAASTLHRISGGRSVERWKVPYALHACCAVTTPVEGVVAIGPEDRFVVVDAHGLREGHVYAQCAPPPTRELYGALEGLATVGERAWAVGLDGVAWRLDASDQWTTFEADSTLDAKVSCIGGIDLPLVAGPRGAAFSIARSWRRLARAPLVTAAAIACDASGRCALVGRDEEREPAVCLLERGRWKVVPWAEEERPDSLRDVAWFKGRLYASGMEGLVCLEKKGLTRVALPRDVSTARLATGAELWSIGERHVLRFDGKTWTPIALK